MKKGREALSLFVLFVRESAEITHPIHIHFIVFTRRNTRFTPRYLVTIVDVPNEHTHIEAEYHKARDKH